VLQGLLDQVKRAIFDDPHNPYQDNHAPGGLIDQISGLFGQHQQQAGTMQNPLPASQDSYGDPADQFPNGGGNAQGGNPQGQFPGIRPASEDPYGDPADTAPGQGGRYAYADGNPSQGGNLQQRFPGIKSASEDPYGDPADQR